MARQEEPIQLPLAVADERDTGSTKVTRARESGPSFVALQRKSLSGKRTLSVAVVMSLCTTAALAISILLFSEFHRTQGRISVRRER